MPNEPKPPAATPARLGQIAAGVPAKAGRLAHIVSTIVRAGVVPFPRIDRGLAELAPLLRYGTTLGGLFAIAAASTPDRIAVIDDDRSVTYGALQRQIGALAHELTDRFGVGEGSAVGVLARNHIGFVQTVIACSRLGADAVLLNTGMSAPQAAAVCKQQRLVALVIDPDLMAMVEGAPADIPRICCGTLDPDLADSAVASTAEMVQTTGTVIDAPEQDGRTVVMTSGTTGAPKGARRPASGGPDAAASILSLIPFRAEETAYIAPPLFHTWGFANLQIAAMLRSTVVLRRRFDPADALRVLSVNRCSTMTVVPVMLQRILDLDPADRPDGDWSALRIVASSGSALPGTLATRWQAAFGPTLYNLYGSTEVSWATIATPQDLAVHPGTAGRAPRGTRLAILDDHDHPVPQGEVGRIFVGNDLQFEGYTGDEPGKAVVDGLMSTGDVGHLDADGLLFVAGRDDDMIVSGGENVYPKEVEDLLASRDDIVEVAVIGVDDDDFGQRLAAFVVVRKPTGKVVARELRDLL